MGISWQISLEIDRFYTDYFDEHVLCFLTAIIICVTTKCSRNEPNIGKAFNIMTSAHFFTTSIKPGSFGTLFARCGDEVSNNGLFQKKSTPPRRKACWKILQDGGPVNSSRYNSRLWFLQLIRDLL